MKRGLHEALRMAVDALGGEQTVGARLWPEMNPISAGERLGHCLQRQRRERLNLDQVAWIFAQAKAAARHEGFAALAELCGYRVTSIIDPQDEIADLARRAAEHAQAATSLSAEAIERMRHAGLKVDA